MPQIPTARQTILPTRQTGIPFRQPFSEEALIAGEQARQLESRAQQIGTSQRIFQTIVGGAQALLEIEEKVGMARASNEFDSATMRASAEMDAFFADLSVETDYSTYQQKYEEASDRIFQKYNEGVTDRRAQEQWTEWWAEQDAQWRIQVFQDGRKQELAHHKVLRNELINEAIQKGDKALAKELIEEAFALDLMFADEAEKAWIDADYQTDMVNAEKTARVMELADAREYLRDANRRPDRLNDEDGEAIIKKLEAIDSEQKKIEKEDRAEYVAETNKRFLEKNVKGELTVADIMASDLDALGQGSKDWWLNKLTEQNEAKTKDEKSKWDITTDEGKSQAMDIVLDPELTTEEKHTEIRSLEGEGLSTDDTWKWDQRIDEPDVPEVAIAYAMFKEEVRKGNIDEIEKAQLQTRFDQIIASQTDAIREDPAKVEEIAQFLIDEQKTNTVKGWMHKLSGGRLFERSVTEEQQEDIDRARELGILPPVEEEVPNKQIEYNNYANMMNSVLGVKVDPKAVRSSTNPTTNLTIFTSDNGATWYKVEGNKLYTMQEDGTWLEMKKKKKRRKK